jgi:hypothetical protein
MANELTQIGVDELKAGQINHMVSSPWLTTLHWSPPPREGYDGQMDASKVPERTRAGSA